MYSTNGIGILPGDNLSYIDHLVPLCQIMGIPILVTDSWAKELIEIYYPPMDIILAQPEDYNLDPYLKGYEVFFYVDFFRNGNGSFQFKEYFSKKKVRSVISLHGNPDKFLDIYWLEHLNDEDIVLVYGSQLVDTLKQKGIRKTPLISGNYRLEFYKEHETFFDGKLPFKKEKATALYAPTWSGKSQFSVFKKDYSPFFKVYKHVFETYSEEYQLIVKLHPHMRRMLPDKVQEIVESYPHICFVNDFPPIYPLLKQVDIYVGDYSSIGYDFLYFDRPMFFLGEKTPLQTSQYQETYQYAFGKQKPLNTLKQEIQDAYRSTPY